MNSTGIEITSADIHGLLGKLNDAGIRLYHVTIVDEITVQLYISNSDRMYTEQLLMQRQEQYRIFRVSRKKIIGKELFNRKILLVGGVLMLLIALLLPTRIFFIKVVGNSVVPDNLILEQAAQCGICVGAGRKNVRSEKMKNALLERIPMLKWAGVNTNGCVATINVREKSESGTQREKASGISSIIAARDGIIQEFTVLEGNALCKVGQAVTAGQILISGYTDCGIVMKGSQAEGEVYAKTLHEITALTPTNYANRGVETSKQVRYGLLIGKKLINFSKDSGISDSSCVKMYSQKYLTLPGGFQLPVALVEESVISYSVEENIKTDAESFDWLEGYAQSYVSSQMIAGKIEASDHEFVASTDTMHLTGHYICTEMIGRSKNEELIQGDAERD